MTKEMYEDLLERNKLQISELNTLTEEQDRHIVELEKENAELKNRNSELAGQKASLERWFGEAEEYEGRKHYRYEDEEKTIKDLCIKCSSYGFCVKGNQLHCAETVAYIKGLAEGKPKWHKVADGDYPPCEKGNYTINVLTDRGDIAYYNYDLDCWIAEPSSTEIDPPITWCELPKFEE